MSRYIIPTVTIGSALGIGYYVHYINSLPHRFVTVDDKIKKFADTLTEKQRKRFMKVVNDCSNSKSGIYDDKLFTDQINCLEEVLINPELYGVFENDESLTV